MVFIYNSRHPAQRAPEPKEPEPKKRRISHAVTNIKQPCRSPKQLEEIARKEAVVAEWWGQDVTIRFIADKAGYVGSDYVHRVAKRLNLAPRQWGRKGGKGQSN